MADPNAFDRLNGRYLLLALFVAWYWQPGFDPVLWGSTRWEWFWKGNLLPTYYFYAALTVFAVWAALWSRVNVRALLGPPPRLSAVPSMCAFGFFLYLVSTAVNTAVYVPLSYPYPDYVRSWLDWTGAPTILTTEFGEMPVGANLMSLASMVILAPVIEELLFRGYLLHRWARKWGLRTAILASSVIFASLHSDPPGAFTFAVAMCVLYLRTGSLLAPVLLHALYNLGMWLIELYGVTTEGLEYYFYDLAEFRAEWWLGAAAGGLAVLMAAAYLRWGRLTGPRRLPSM